jgi:hypothetical protein
VTNLLVAAFDTRAAQDRTGSPDIELGDKSVLDPLLRRVLISTASTA